MNAVPRTAGWDALKAGTTLLVVFHHTAITYGAIGGWFYRERAPDGSLPNLLLILFCTINQAWFMGLFFLLAGRFAAPALARRGAVSFLRERLLRLGLPWLAFGFVLGPLTVALAQTVRGEGFVEALLTLWRHGVFVTGPLWFAQALLMFSLALAAWWQLWPRSLAADARLALALPSDRALLLAALGCGAAAFLLRLVWPVGSEIWSLQLGYFASYALLFVVGCLAARGQWLERIPPDRMRRWRRIGAWTLPTLLPLALLGKVWPVFSGSPMGGWNVPSLMYALWEPFVAWGALIWLLSVFGRRQNAARPWRQALARRAYGIYVIHPPVLVAVALAWRDVAAPALLKFVITGTLACALCFWLTGGLLRVPWLRRIF